MHSIAKDCQYIQHKWLKHLNHLHGSSVKPEDIIGPAQIHDDHTETSSSMGRQHVQDAVSSENTMLIVEKTLLDGSPIFQTEEQWKQLWSDSEIPLSPISTRDSTAALELLQAIVRFSFNKIVSDWRGYIKVMGSHISRLEEQIYDKPEDDSKAKELWSMSKQLLEMEKLLISQTFLIKVVQANFISPATAGPDTVEKDWLKDLWTDLEELRNNIQEDLIKAVTQMVDLMYKSVSIRDARKSVELNTSLWRLSWITFILLPLTFLVGFFGMNVDTFIIILRSNGISVIMSPSPSSQAKVASTIAKPAAVKVPLRSKQSRRNSRCSQSSQAGTSAAVKAVEPELPMQCPHICSLHVISN
ncbi:MAG: hypothetical protein FRX48_04616 [Lasallia pustulata]|uniref:Mg2+ transporter protein, CorA-like/Zinc transport protein ZntB n=1 Tax=Lasallia pustulata TaxID=136370 RepID=A0A5M8PP61_9LECA|nr:MAG: hypothetical protein FRX48_04616 [Lasallia pustulata]